MTKKEKVRLMIRTYVQMADSPEKLREMIRKTFPNTWFLVIPINLKPILPFSGTFVWVNSWNLEN